ncbi:hypothetical protein [Paenibacillus nasutitermitis]|uniref:Uncharacterized protein n=1 Tax=Paenibacillus nasutitermitis TaxID=1652958 RepID=A0A916Z0H7_9BACL|nr:hypothetical protein [Paenibacillus nasutitermitis]GGD70433.1 hypothetical protein GCM10010911_30360 [Paenibacillus nasutitermitis]
MWQQIWFIVNMFFVALLIIFLFSHRSVIQARQEKAEQRIRSAVRKRFVFGVLTVLAFLGMSLSFVMNMKVNG